ncbi:hypothetical protein MSSIT_3263 [Methanosarcina siciliae T4/M]|uniref:PEF-CTERM protein sorting domain-containing protein n=1 Tax=Methanosarcina siciliae T4/M TaxID=1434120 RepID=A0A0E3P7U6_9EURY|nr:PEF-CTERM sorting domain-containing protein [Methanosarcina siciliae]AKB29982.1 hypothetical protein MSSIT_3263 [Methanosarcina siciliae T4/M]
MKTNLLCIILILAVVTIMVTPASAGEVTITFDDGIVVADQDVDDAYADLGVTFEGAKVIDTKLVGTDLGFTPKDDFCTINFSPYVTSVSIDFKDDLAEGNMDGLLVNGEKISDSECTYVWIEKTLHIESSAQNPIKSVQLYGIEYLPCICTKITFDNLKYTQIPEFPTVALPAATVLGMIFVFQRRKN